MNQEARDRLAKVFCDAQWITLTGESYPEGEDGRALRRSASGPVHAMTVDVLSALADPADILELPCMAEVRALVVADVEDAPSGMNVINEAQWRHERRIAARDALPESVKRMR